MQVTASAKYIRISPQKVKLVADQIKKMPPRSALGILDFVRKSGAHPLKKVINSAIANAKNNHGLLEETLIFKSIVVEKGPVLKRQQAASRGRAHPILKRTSHIKVVLIGEQKKLKTASNKETNDLEPNSQNQKSKTKNQNEKQ